MLQLGRYLAPHKPSSSFFKPLFKAQITRIKQFLKEDNTILSVDELTCKVNTSVHQYCTMASSLPFLQNGRKHKSKQLAPKCSSWRPSKQQRSIREQNTKSRFHKRKYPQSVLVAFLITKDSKLIAFQFKIIHRILPTKSSLFQAGITESDICSSCAKEK